MIECALHIHVPESVRNTEGLSPDSASQVPVANSYPAHMFSASLLDTYLHADGRGSARLPI